MASAQRFEELRLDFAEAAGKFDGLSYSLSILHRQEDELMLLRMPPVQYDIPCYVPFPNPLYRECAVLVRTSGDGETPFKEFKQLAASAWYELPLSLRKAVLQGANESFQVDGQSGYACWVFLLWCDKLYSTDTVDSPSCMIDPFERSANLIEAWGLNTEPSHPPSWVLVEHTETGDASTDVNPEKIVTWQDAAKSMQEMMDRGDPFTSQPKLGKQIGCSSFTINKAIKKTPALSEWSKKQRASATGMLSLEGKEADSIPQKRETDPSEILEPDDIDVAMRKLMEQASPDERARINEMNPAERQKLAQTAYRDPDFAEQAWRRRQPKPSDD